ncbi:MAG: hypothetical protein JSV37_13905, partial [Anaerolineaceae bacterium]
MPAIMEILRAIRSIGLGSTLQTVRYAMQRDRSERRLLKRERPALVIQPGKLNEYHLIDNGARYSFAHAEVELKFLATNLVRITWQPGALPLPYALAKTEWPVVELETHDRGISSSQIEVVVSEDGDLTFLDAAGELLRKEIAPSCQGESWSIQSDLATDEHVYGLGDRASPLNLRGGTYRMWSTDPGGSYGLDDDPLYLNIPAYLSLHSRGSSLIFYENSFDGSFHVDD